MSSQGKASNDNGIELRKQVARKFHRFGVQYRTAVRTSLSPRPGGHSHDFMATISESEFWVECKYHSGMQGTIWQKISYTLDLLAYQKGFKMLILGGHQHPAWIENYIRDKGKRMGIHVFNLSELEDFLEQNCGEPIERESRPDRSLSYRPPLD